MPPEVDAAFQQLLTYNKGGDSAPLDTIENAIAQVEHSFGRSREYEARLIEVLSGSKLSLSARRFAAEQLARVATEKSVPAFERLLYEPDTSGIARLALERIPGIDAEDALLRALAKTTDTFRVAIVESLGRRQSPAAVEPLIKLTGKGDPRVMAAAMRALGEIGGTRAVKDLLWCRQNVAPELRPVATEAFFRCAEKRLARGDSAAAVDLYETLFVEAEPADVRRTALAGMLKAEGDRAVTTIRDVLLGADSFLYDVALRAVPEVPGERATGDLIRLLPALSISIRPGMIEALAVRGAPEALPSIHEAAFDRDAAVSLAALESLATLSDGNSVPVLLEFAVGTDVEKAARARHSLLEADGDGFDDGLVRAAMGSNNVVRAEAVRTIIARNATVGTPILLRLAEREADALQLEALHGLKLMATEAELPRMVALLANQGPGPVRDEAVRAVIATTMRLDKEIDRTLAIREALQRGVRSAETRVVFVDMLGEIGDDSGLPAIRAVTRRADPLVDAAAVRVLSQWQNSTPLNDLADIARRLDDPALRRTATDGLVRLLQLPERRTDELQLRYHRRVKELAVAPDQKKQILERILTMSGDGVRNLIALYLEDPDVGELAARALAAHDPAGD